MPVWASEGRVRAGGRSAPAAAGHAIAVALGVASTALAAAGSTTASLWTDEAASVSAARRSLPALWAMVHNIDAVHGTYYLFLHLWFDLVGYSVFTLRFPSAVALGVAVWATTRIGVRVGGLTVGFASGCVLALFPAMTIASVQGREFAAGAAASAVLTLLYLSIIERRSRGRGRLLWVVYGVVLLVAVHLLISIVLVALAHAVHLLLQLRPARRNPSLRGNLIGFFSCAVVVAIASVPLALLSSGERGEQLWWLSRLTISGHTLRTVLAQWYLETQSGPVALPLEIFAWACTAIGIAVLFTVYRRQWDTTTLILIWAFLPTVALVVVSLWVPSYFQRYVTFSAPAVALLIGFTLGRIRPVPLIAVGLLAWGLLAWPAWQAVRQTTANDDSSWNVAADTLAADRSHEGGSGSDAIIFGDVPHHDVTAQDIAVAYPRAFAGMDNLSERVSASDAAELRPVSRTPAQAAARVPAEVRSVWVLAGAEQNVQARVGPPLSSRGFRLAGSQRIGTLELDHYVRVAGSAP